MSKLELLQGLKSPNLFLAKRLGGISKTTDLGSKTLTF